MKQQILLVEYQKSMLENAFSHFDKDKSGYLDREQLSSALRNYGDAFTPEEEEEFFQLADADQNGQISKAGTHTIEFIINESILDFMWQRKYSYINSLFICLMPQYKLQMW